MKNMHQRNYYKFVYRGTNKENKKIKIKKKKPQKTLPKILDKEYLKRILTKETYSDEYYNIIKEKRKKHK
jgi:site-specific recombinase XerD